jgi:hypothetical protein
VLARLRSWYLLNLTKWASSSSVVVSLSGGVGAGFVHCEGSGMRTFGRGEGEVAWSLGTETGVEGVLLVDGIWVGGVEDAV